MPKVYRNGPSWSSPNFYLTLISSFIHEALPGTRFKFNTPWSQRSCRQIPWTDDKWSIYSEIRILFFNSCHGSRIMIRFCKIYSEDRYILPNLLLVVDCPLITCSLQTLTSQILALRWFFSAIDSHYFTVHVISI